MAIPATEIVMSMRYALGDMQGVNISDYELLEPINQAVNKLYTELGQRHIREAIRTSGRIRIDTSAYTDVTNTVTTTNTYVTLEDGTYETITSILDIEDEGDEDEGFTADIEITEEGGDNVGASSITSYQYYTLPEGFVRIYQVLGAFTDKAPSKSKYQIIIPTTGIVNVKGTYRVTRNQMRMCTGWYYVQYYYVPARVKTLAGSIDVPEAMRSWIEKLSVAIFKNDPNEMQVILKQAEDSFAGREIPRFENAEHSQTLGTTAAR